MAQIKKANLKKQIFLARDIYIFVRKYINPNPNPNYEPKRKQTKAN